MKSSFFLQVLSDIPLDDPSARKSRNPEAYLVNYVSQALLSRKVDQAHPQMLRPGNGSPTGTHEEAAELGMDAELWAGFAALCRDKNLHWGSLNDTLLAHLRNSDVGAGLRAIAILQTRDWRDVRTVGGFIIAAFRDQIHRRDGARKTLVQSLNPAVCAALVELCGNKGFSMHLLKTPFFTLLASRPPAEAVAALQQLEARIRFLRPEPSLQLTSELRSILRTAGNGTGGAVKPESKKPHTEAPEDVSEEGGHKKWGVRERKGAHSQLQLLEGESQGGDGRWNGSSKGAGWGQLSSHTLCAAPEHTSASHAMPPTKPSDEKYTNPSNAPSSALLSAVLPLSPKHGPFSLASSDNANQFEVRMFPLLRIFPPPSN